MQSFWNFKFPKGNFPLSVFHHFMKTRALTRSAIHASPLGNKAYKMSDSRSQNSGAGSGKKCFQSGTMQNPPCALDQVPRPHGTAWWRCGLSGSSPSLLCESVYKPSLQVMHMNQALRRPLPKSLQVPPGQFSLVRLASQFCRLQGWHSDISICGWWGRRGWRWGSRILMHALDS